MQFLRSFFKRIIDDLKQKKLIPLKVLFFVHASTLFVLYPYLTIHMRELGIDVEETAVMSAVTPVVSIVMPPLAGMLADKIGNFRLLLGLSSALGGLSALLLLAVPVGRLTLTYPPAAELVARCDAGRLALHHLRNHPCAPQHPYAYDVTLTVLSCGFVCELPQNTSSELPDTISHVQSYDIHIKSSVASSFDYRHTVTARRPHVVAPKTDQSSSRLLKNDPYFNITISRVSDKSVYFPAPNLFSLDCTLDSSNGTCDFGKGEVFDSETINNYMYRMRISHTVQQLKEPVKKYSVEAISPVNVSHPLPDPDYDGVDSVTCKDHFTSEDTSSDGADGVLVRAGGAVWTRCSSACAVVAPRKALCENQKQHIEIDPGFTFWTYLVVRVFIGIIGGTAFAMFEGAVIAIVREQRADYGLQRVYGSLGGMISSPLSGMLIDYASRGKGYTDFRPAFYLYAVLKVASGGLMLSIDLQFKQPAQNLLHDVVSVFRNVEIVGLFIACFIMGTAWGYIESFLFWLLQDLGASRSLMGITITVGGVAGLPLLVLSGPIIKRLGHANVIFIGFIFYAIRLLGYSLIYNPWLCLIFEALESVTSSLSFTAAVTYAARLSSTTTDTSVQGLLGGIYYGVGKGAGSLIGGFLMKQVGTRTTYQIFATATLVTGCIYYLFNRFYLRKRITIQEDDTCKKKPAILDVEFVQDSDKEKGSDVDGTVKKIEDTVVVDDTTKVVDEKRDSKTALDSADGGSDSGVDNPAFIENETTPNDSSQKDNSKAID